MMKKQYGAPIAEKMVFDYEENVVASDTSDTPDLPSTTANVSWSGNPHVGNKGQCQKVNKC